jgi:peptidyl-prolyl cis-trans isomerase C
MLETIATVNGQPITRRDLDSAVQGFAMDRYRKTKEHLAAEELAALEEMAVERLLARELIFQEALARGVVADEAAVAAEEEKIIANFPSAEEFAGTLEKAGISAAAYHRMVRQDLTVNLMTERKFAELPEPDAAEIETFYREHPERMVYPLQVRASHLLIRAEADEAVRREARERIAELKGRAATEDFATLAREHSQCPSAGAGGDLGYFRRGTMAPEFEEAAFAQQVGEVGEVVETQFGVHLIKVLDRRAEAPMSLEEAMPKIRTFLREDAGARLLKEWVAELKARAEICLTL